MHMELVVPHGYDVHAKNMFVKKQMVYAVDNCNVKFSMYFFDFPLTIMALKSEGRPCIWPRLALHNLLVVS